MTDLFDEVEEQLRSERYRTLAMKALPWVLGIAAAVLIAVFSVWGWQQYRTQQAAKASEQYTAALEALNQGHRDQAVQLWTQVSQSPSTAYKSLALMQLGGLKLADRNTPDAVKLFDQAATAAPDDILGDAARLKSAFALLDTAPQKDLEARLTPLMQDGHPYRVQAREALGFAKLMAGDAAGARGQFVVITQSLDASDGARERAKAAMDLIDSGSAKTVSAVAKAAAALPPPVMLAPGQTSPALPPQPQAPGPQ
ncbi:MAG: hypothetical protein JWP50_3083 [Phenylobacterium sp.]|nr:hypothetical protein [Phenylobacterium sp.]